MTDDHCSAFANGLRRRGPTPEPEPRQPQQQRRRRQQPKEREPVSQSVSQPVSQSVDGAQRSRALKYCAHPHPNPHSFTLTSASSPPTHPQIQQPHTPTAVARTISRSSQRQREHGHLRMAPSSASVHTAVRLLKEKEEQRKRRGAVVLRELATDVRNKECVCSSGGLELLLDLLELPCAEVTLVIATEVIALLVTENDDARVSVLPAASQLHGSCSHVLLGTQQDSPACSTVGYESFELANKQAGQAGRRVLYPGALCVSCW